MDPPHSTGAPFSFQLIKSCDAAETTLSLANIKAPFFFLWDPSLSHQLQFQRLVGPFTTLFIHPHCTIRQLMISPSISHKPTFKIQDPYLTYFPYKSYPHIYPMHALLKKKIFLKKSEKNPFLFKRKMT